MSEISSTPEHEAVVLHNVEIAHAIALHLPAAMQYTLLGSAEGSVQLILEFECVEGPWSLGYAMPARGLWAAN